MFVLTSHLLHIRLLRIIIQMAMKSTKRNNIFAIFFFFQALALLFCMSGFGWFPTVMGVCILISIIVDYWKNYTTLYPVYMRLSVTMFYGFIFFILFIWFGWNNILLLILCVIIINTYMSVVRIFAHKVSDTLQLIVKTKRINTFNTLAGRFCL